MVVRWCEYLHLYNLPTVSVNAINMSTLVSKNSLTLSGLNANNRFITMSKESLLLTPTLRKMHRRRKTTSVCYQEHCVNKVFH